MNDSDIAIAVAQEGAAVVRLRFGSALQRLDKGDGDFATNADVEAENAMIALLHRERPADVVLAEESGRSGATIGLRTWLIDPLCGTLNYAVRMRVVAVNVALKVGDTFVAAAVADPFNDEVFWTDGVSAFLRADGKDTPLVPDGSSKLVELNLDPPFSNAPAFKTANLAADSGFAASFRPRVVSTTVALSWVATGQRAAYVTDGEVHDSVTSLLESRSAKLAGCVVTDCEVLRVAPVRQGLWRRIRRRTQPSCL